MNVRQSYSFPADLTQAIVNCLAARPWAEVNNLMQAIQAEVARQETPPKLPDDPPTDPAQPPAPA